MNKLLLLWLLLTPLSCMLADAGTLSTPTTVSQEALMSIPISSSAFTAGASIPAKYSCKGQSISPPLAWGDPPSGTQSFALIMDDPDAPSGTFVHWVIYNIPGSSRELPEAIQADTHFQMALFRGTTAPGGLVTPVRVRLRARIATSLNYMR